MTGLAEAIKSIATEQAKKAGLDFVPAEYLGLACVWIMIDKAILTGKEYSEDEYEELHEELDEVFLSADIDSLKETLAAKDYTDEDRRIARTFIRQASILSTYNALLAYEYVMDQTGFEDMVRGGDNDKKKKPDMKRLPEPSDDKPEESNDEPKAKEDQGETIKLSGLLAMCNDLRRELLDKVYGQDYAVKRFVEGFFRGEMDGTVNPKHKGPRAIFLFAGSPGVGKTFLAETAAEKIGREYKRFDMSGYGDIDAVQRLSGVPKTYAAPKEGELTGFVKKHPMAVVLFDEIEKAHFNVILQFLQILDRGRLQDAKTLEDVDFGKTIIIFTTNAGKQLYEDKTRKKLSGTPAKVVIDALEKDIDPRTKEPFFPQAICSRLAAGNVIMFNHLSAGDLMRITSKELEKVESDISNTYGKTFDSGKELIPTILYSLGGSADGRNASATAKKMFYSEFQELLRLVSESKGPEAVDEIGKISFKVDMSNASDEVQNLYNSEEETLALVFAGEEYALLEDIKLSNGKILVTDDEDAFHRIIVREEPEIIFVDYYLGISEKRQNTLNSEDVSSRGRDAFFTAVSECPESTLYVLETSTHHYNDEERLSLTGRGAADILVLENADKKKLSKQMEDVFVRACYQRAIDYLASHHQVLSFESAQYISDDKSTAAIEFFDLKLAQAIEAEDQKSMLSASSAPNVHWEDIVVSDKLKEDLKYAISFMQNPRKFTANGGVAPKGMLMYGPPGTGKTSLAKVVATESNVNFIEMSAEEFTDKYVGEGPRKVHEAFSRARKYAPAILFIDEIDAVGASRGTHTGEISHDILNAILTELDGFKTSAKRPVFIMAATNLKESLDKALLSRFDQKVEVDLPGRKERTAIFELHRSKKPDLLKISDEKIDNLSNRSIGQSPRDLVNIINNAVKDAHSAGLTEVTDEIIDNAFERYISGEGKPWTDKEVERVAIHEGGHTVVNVLLGNKPSYLTIVSRGNHGGYMMHGDIDDKHITTRQQMLDDVCCALGGRAAEIIYYGDEEGITTGPSGDLQQATKMLRNMICTYGMYDDVGMISDDADEGKFSSETEAIIEKKINEILAEQLYRAKQIITDNKAKMEGLINALKEKQYLTGNEIQKAMGMDI